MAKVTVDDKFSNGETQRRLLPQTRDAINNGVIAALRRIGDADDLIEVIKVEPTDIRTLMVQQSGIQVSKLLEEVNVKMVIGLEIYTENRPTPVKIEKNIRIIFDDVEKTRPEEITDHIQQLIVRNFQSSIAKLADILLDKSEGLRATLAIIGIHETSSGNDNRCVDCGCMRLFQNKQRICPRCQPHLMKIVVPMTQVANKPPTDLCPTCPDCGFTTTPTGACFKCENCGRSVGCT